MDGWIGVIVMALAVVAVLTIPLVVLAGRRRWLARQGGTFECSLRLHPTAPGSGWVLGVARYNAEILEWFRFFSYSYGPRMRFKRCEVQVVESRPPDAVEAVSLYAGQQVVRLQVSRPDPRTGRTEPERPESERADSERVEQWDLAMSGDSLTGLLSWLEAAPPGVGSYGVSAP